MFRTTTSRLRFDRLAFAAAAFVALFAVVALVAHTVAVGAGSVVVAAVALAVGVVVATALPFLVVRAMSEVAFR